MQFSISDNRKLFLKSANWFFLPAIQDLKIKVCRSKFDFWNLIFQFTIMVNHWSSNFAFVQ